MKKSKSLLAFLVLLASLFMFGALSSMAAPKFNANLNVNISSIKAGELVTAKAGVQNADPKESYQYKFVWSCNNWQKWGVINDFSSKSQVSLRPYTPGNYIIHVDIKDSKGNIITKSVPFKMDLGWDAKLSTSVPKRIIGETVSAKAGVTNPSNRMSYSYKFVWSCNNWQSWGVISDFSSKNNVSFTPKKQGNYVIYADIKDSLGNVVTKSSSFKMDLGWNASLSASVPSNKTGSTITAKANVTSSLENGNYKYKFVWSRNNWQSWGIISDFSSKNNMSFSPKSNGNYEIYADIKDSFGNVITKTKSFNIVSDWQAKQPGISMSNNVPGSKVTITANTSKPVSGAKYKFVYSYNNWSEWGVISDFSGKRTVDFYPKKTGTYEIYTDITDAGGSLNTYSRSFNIRSDKYKLVVNLRTQTVSALSQNADGSYGASVRNMPCSTGKSKGSTPSGTFPLKTKYRWHVLNGGVWGQWCSRVVGGVLFHSVPYRSANNKTLITKYYNQLGSPASAGCIRLRAVDAKWIYDNCAEGTPVQIGSFNSPSTPGKANARRIKSSTTWDPTDPSLSGSYYNKGWS